MPVVCVPQKQAELTSVTAPPPKNTDKDYLQVSSRVWYEAIYVCMYYRYRRNVRTVREVFVPTRL